MEASLIIAEILLSREASIEWYSPVKDRARALQTRYIKAYSRITLSVFCFDYVSLCFVLEMYLLFCFGDISFVMIQRCIFCFVSGMYLLFGLYQRCLFCFNDLCFVSAICFLLFHGYVLFCSTHLCGTSLYHFLLTSPLSSSLLSFSTFPGTSSKSAAFISKFASPHELSLISEIILAVFWIATVRLGKCRLQRASSRKILVIGWGDFYDL